ncbi:DUF2946 domain-containing protein [Paraburkholderia sp. MMS20-SJTN17]|uniref:DUF2946 domain-containing protein n=1 Tax=Paraburkholderia translucens TaxID=2886945 RepID=A0ABS8KJG3_9BURK|nr:DUF2946 domain-containing protein [Paraburkholderia sp. MMS20-SJTN17]MCC8404837.1 DUF2946 domain-containing protein [Paraburkholderia sp. MMS20-SJTN17]
MLNRWHRKIGGWLGLLAILMTTLAPTISQTLAAHSPAEAMPGEHCHMAPMDDMASMPGMQMAGDTPDAAEAAANPPHESDAANDPASKHAQMSGDACGYCSLLAHLPVMPSVGMLFVAAVHARHHTAAARFDSVRRVEPLSFAQPRAPPSAS